MILLLLHSLILSMTVKALADCDHNLQLNPTESMKQITNGLTTLTRLDKYIR